jgi:hypothetical protein
MKVNIKFRNEFGSLDDMVFMTPADVASVIAAPSLGSVYTQLNSGELPEPLIRKNRQIRWTVGQIRAHIKAQVEALRLAQAELGESREPLVAARPVGRPRKECGQGTA